MSRAAKRRAAREAKKGPILEAPKGSGEIQLFNPVTQHFEAFIFGNATECDAVVQMDSAKGKTVVICGAGPSLRAHAAEYCPQGDEVWGVNSAAPWLYEHGYMPTHAFSVDQTPTMLKEWVDAYPMKYMLASTCHVHLAEYLKLRHRPIEFFHNFVGIAKPPVGWDNEDGIHQTSTYEDWMYMSFFDPTVRAGSGLNGVTRAVDVALFKGFDRIIVLGADCAMEATGVIPKELEQGSAELVAWLDANTEFHADGASSVTNGQSPMTLQGEIDGRLWTTKPDLMITAIQIAKWLQGDLPQLEVIGDVLPNALKEKDQEFFDKLPALSTSAGKRIPV